MIKVFVGIGGRTHSLPFRSSEDGPEFKYKTKWRSLEWLKNKGFQMLPHRPFLDADNRAQGVQYRDNTMGTIFYLSGQSYTPRGLRELGFTPVPSMRFMDVRADVYLQLPLLRGRNEALYKGEWVPLDTLRLLNIREAPETVSDSYEIPTRFGGRGTFQGKFCGTVASRKKKG